jgi:hypothetical protein
MSRIRLIASSDDYLLEERLSAAVAEVRRSLGDVEAEVLGDETTPAELATELVSPSLFAAERVLVVADARRWLGARPPAGAAADAGEPPDSGPLVEVLASGVPDEVGLVVGAWCGRQPTGPLVDAIRSVGAVDWISLPPPPKPWEDTLLSSEQERVLRGLLERAAEGAVFEPDARRLLLDRLGFAPRLLVQEVRKLAGAVGDGAIDEALVRRLTFPRERSVEVVRDAVLERRPEPLVDLVAAAAAGLPVNDWQGRRVDADGLAAILQAQVSRLAIQLLYLRRLAAGLGLAAEMAPDQTGRGGWYQKRFKNELAPGLLSAVAEGAPSPLLTPGGRAPTPFSLAAMFAGAGRYTDDELVAAVAAAADVEVRIRSTTDHALDAVTAWLAGFVVAA